MIPSLLLHVSLLREVSGEVSLFQVVHARVAVNIEAVV
jgi:hypothetical protein